MKKTFFIILLGFFLFPNFSFAQVPGYRGKRLLIDYDLLLIPSLLSERDIVKGLTKLNLRHNFGVEYVVARNGSVGVNFGIFNTTYTAYDIPIVDNSNYYSYTYVDKEISIKVNSIGVYYKFFKSKKKGFIAPLGNYSRLGLQTIWGTSNFTTPTEVYDSYSSSYGEQYVGTISQIALTYGWGKQFIVYKTLMGKFGLEFGIPYNGGQVKTEASRKLANKYILNLETGLAFLIK